jgi:2-polyprenyl-3-methyl-5-hydroxy-6-metoxy-1,4-benzoquinol methylase
MEIVSICPICSKDIFKTAMSCRDHTVSHEIFQILQCETCGFRFTSPRPDEKEISRYYQSEDYISHSDTSHGFINKLYQLVRNYTIKQKVRLVNDAISSTNTATKTLLDIGCGTGEFLNSSKEDGWTITGIEPSAVARKNAEQKYGILPLPQERFSELNKKEFHAITLWHVIEHIHQLEITIDHIKKILLNEGKLIIAVPNANSWDAKKYGEFWAAWDVPRHLYHFTEKDMTMLLKKFGFKLERVVPMKFDSFYVSLLSEKYKTDHMNIIEGFKNGLVSNIYASQNGYSSQVYIFQSHN